MHNFLTIIDKKVAYFQNKKEQRKMESVIEILAV